MNNMPSNDREPASPFRRRLLQGALLLPAAAALATLPGCSVAERVDGSFLQPWREHLQWEMADWQRPLHLAQRLGCRHLVLQWAGIFGGDDGDWQLSDTGMRMLLTAAAESGLQVRVGLPFEQRWWQAIGADDATLQAFFAESLGRARQWLANVPWARMQAFGGWYLPYELEQYHWATPTRQEMLGQWLLGMQQAAEMQGGDCAVSTYFSRLPTEGSLVALWESLLARVNLRPMVQDGVGVAGIGNLLHLQPLLQLFTRQGTAFDAIVELFRELPGSAQEGNHFKAESADFERIRHQLQWASGSGAGNVLLYAVDPWLSQDTPQAKALRRRWRI